MHDEAIVKQEKKLSNKKEICNAKMKYNNPIRFRCTYEFFLHYNSICLQLQTILYYVIA